MGDVNQLPPVAMKSIANDSNFNYSCSANTIRKIAFFEFMDRHKHLKTITFTFHMTDVVRQKDEQFKHIVTLMRDETLTNEK